VKARLDGESGPEGCGVSGPLCSRVRTMH